MIDGRRGFLVGAIGAAAVSPYAQAKSATDIAVEAMDTVLRNWIANLMTIWLKGADGQPARAAEGVRKAIASYHLGRGLVGYSTATDAHIRSLLMKALDDALLTYLVGLFNVWLHETG